jgi:hypothetical protein
MRALLAMTVAAAALALPAGAAANLAGSWIWAVGWLTALSLAGYLWARAAYERR